MRTGSCMVRPGQGKPNQDITPIGTMFPPEETVHIIDPRHPLYGQTLPLVGITNRSYLGHCCVIAMPGNVERNIPLTATDRSAEPLVLFPLPLDLLGLQRLLHTYARLMRQSEQEVPHDASSPPAHPHADGPSDPHPARYSVGTAQPGPTPESAPSPHHPLPTTGRTSRPASRRRPEN